MSDLTNRRMDLPDWLLDLCLTTEDDSELGREIRELSRSRQGPVRESCSAC